MSNIKKKAEAVRAFLVPFVELAGALESVAELSADEQRLKEATSEISAMQREVERLNAEAVALKAEIKAQSVKNSDAIEKAKEEAKRIVGAAVSEANRVKDEANLVAHKSMEEIKKATEEQVSEFAKADAKRKEIEKEIASGEKKLADVRAKIAAILAGA